MNPRTVVSHAARAVDKGKGVYDKLIGGAKAALDSSRPIIAYYDFNRNWGDALNPVLVRHISGKDPLQTSEVYNFLGRPVYSVIGSILGNYHLPTLEVWGSGFIGPERIFLTPPAKIHAVRGPLTRDVILRLGLPCPAIFGDPALLYPRYYRPAVKPDHEIGIVAHYMDRGAEWLTRIAREAGALIIDVSSPVEEFVDQLCSCRFIASSSLHGVIAADAYRIPFAWLSLSNRLVGGTFKFEDYFLSTGRQGVRPLEVEPHMPLERIYDAAITSPSEIDLDSLFQACPFRRDELG